MMRRSFKDGVRGRFGGDSNGKDEGDVGCTKNLFCRGLTSQKLGSEWMILEVKQSRQLELI
jgi:hypothetical protein